jgi:hypothetical protein
VGCLTEQHEYQGNFSDQQKERVGRALDISFGSD